MHDHQHTCRLKPDNCEHDWGSADRRGECGRRSLEWTAGAVICGACFGDKMSPMSDTTNFAAGIGEIPIFEHIRHMMGTTIPALLITIVLFYFLGLSVSADVASTDDIQHVITGIKDAANVTPWALLSPLLVVLLAIKRVSVIPVLTIGIISSGILTAILYLTAACRRL